MVFLKLIKRELKRSLTIMLIPHNSIKAVRIKFSLSFLLFVLFSWTLFTVWAGYLSSRHIDYWKIQADNKLMKLKVIFFAEQVKKSQELLEQVRENDEQVRTLLGMKSKKAIVEVEGRGGPNKADIEDLNRLLSGKIYEISQDEINNQAIALQEQTQKRIESYNEIVSHIQVQRSIYRATPNIWPCSGRITSSYGYRIHPVYKDTEFHSGMDIANTKGTPILATAEGKVRLAGWQPGYGCMVIIEHGHGYTSCYGHLFKLLSKTGQHIERGQVIGLMGNSGTSTGYHLHYELRYNGRVINPANFLKKMPTQFALNKNNKLGV